MHMTRLMTLIGKSLKENMKLVLTILIVVAVSVVVTWWVLVGSKTQAQRDLAHAKDLVGRHMILPTDEEPTLAVVTDKTVIKDKFLTKNANNGDQVLIYTQHQIAII